MASYSGTGEAGQGPSKRSAAGSALAPLLLLATFVCCGTADEAEVALASPATHAVPEQADGRSAESGPELAADAEEAELGQLSEALAAVACFPRPPICVGNSVRSCVNGAFVTQPCPSGCSNGRCLACTPGSSSCVGNSVRSCVGGAFVTMSCANGCSNGACIR
ncbi:MAG: hypothetical protein ABI895_21260 [Deltaproteobacteria bacterium]